MSKTTKIIAALGVVAGLGVAALPAFTYAAQTQQSTTGEVDVIVEVQPAIAMTITGNNDDGSLYGTPTSFTAATPAGTENPSEEGWYERSGTDPDYTYAPTTDTELDAGKTYYVYSGSYRPVDSFNPADVAGGEIDGHSTPGFSITGTSSSYKSILPNSIYNATDGSFASTVTIYTNSKSGYNVTVGAVNTGTEQEPVYQTALVHTTDSTKTIPANASLAAGTSAWAYNIIASSATSPDAAGTADKTGWNAITGPAAQIAHEDNATNNGTEYVVNYGVSTSADQATGVYRGTIVYTATTK